MDKHSRMPAFIYTYACTEEELSLCHLEMRSFFGFQPEGFSLKSEIYIEPSRSPFMKERIEVMYEGDELSDIVKQVEQIDIGNDTFKIIFLKINDLEKSAQIGYDERRKIERQVGWPFKAEADVRNPDHTFGITTLGGRWYFGKYCKSEPVWLHHLKKPREYSTALSTRVARAAANIAVPNPDGIKAIDPCCGIGTVLVEALSMGINIVGRDINPLVTDGSRENIAHFGYECDVITGPISEVTEKYDVAIIDMPYNLYTHATPAEQLSILKHARRIADKVVVVTSETMDHMIEEAGFKIADRCVVKKQMFMRQVLVCE
ncbi:RNA methyltransferase [Bacillus sp. PAMC26568]|nr:RNA methyltransferase [Bacillus sp. UMB0893]PLR66010.1 RNA methyltransferase [Bacillus sp. UMB0893]QNG60760.1 RNA methyltransferase [Bacillus sp. PAMC26568]